MKPNSKPIKPPKYLRRPTRAWWQRVVDTWVLGEHHVRVLTLAGEAWDRGAEAREILASAGPYFTNRFGEPRLHPAVGVERDSRIAFARLLRELDLDVEPPPDAVRPPNLRRFGGK